jgi:S1-C subfamily serine protease
MGLSTCLLFLVASGPSQPRESSADDRAVVVVREKLGIELAVAESRLRRSIISTRTPYGFLIRRVEPHSLAERAGLRAGDILLEWSGAPIEEVEPLAKQLERALVDGGRVPVVYARKRPNVPLTFPATDPWQTRRTSLRFDRGAPPRRVAATLARELGRPA